LDIQHRVILGDSRKTDEVADESVHLVVTPPPCWQLKDYGNVQQISCDDSCQSYRGLVFVDRESDYREKERFITLAGSFVS